MRRWSSASVIGWSGRFRSWLWVVVKPFHQLAGDADAAGGLR